MIKIAAAGVGGRMGRAIAKAAYENPDTVLAAAFVRPGHPWAGNNLGDMLGVPDLVLTIDNDPENSLEKADVLIDFTSPESAAVHAQMASRQGKALVIGVTGINSAQKREIEVYAKNCPIVMSSNMSWGVNVILGLIRPISEILGSDYALEVMEAYHDLKGEARDGAAHELVHELTRIRQWDTDELCVNNRQGDSGALPDREIGVHSLRGGDIVGENTVYFIGQSERLELTYLGQSPEPYARGALKAAYWAASQNPGLYSMRDVLEQSST